MIYTTLTSTFKKAFFICFITLLTSSYTFSQSCNAILSVEKNRNVRSVDEDGTVFPLELKNTSSSSLSFKLSSIFLESGCDTKGVNFKNVPLDVEFVSGKNNTINSDNITIGAGQTYSFRVKVNIPKGTPFNRWSCIEIQAFSEKCNSVSDTTTLKVFVPNPSEG